MNGRSALNVDFIMELNEVFFDDLLYLIRRKILSVKRVDSNGKTFVSCNQ
jgi:hypothetical protein